jgi:hypothetical protein
MYLVFDINCFYMRILTGLWFFYQRLIIPSLILSYLTALFAPPDVSINFSIGFGISIMLFMPLFHFFLYEVNNPQEYYYYHNLGLSKLMLWAFTILSSSVLATFLFLS